MHILTVYIGLFCLFSPAVFANSPDVPDPYYARTAPRRGSEIDHILAQARFLFGHRGTDELPDSRMSPFTPQEVHVICAFRRSLPLDRGAGFTEVLAHHLVSFFYFAHHEDILIALLRHDFCLSPAHRPVSAPVRTALHVHFDIKKRVISKNPVWNACVRGENLSVDLIRMNADVFIHRQGRMIKKVPYTCRDYHPGPQNLWLYPDQPGLRIFVDKKARLLGIDPSSIDLGRRQDEASIASK